jgi:hypothetical protein
MQSAKESGWAGAIALMMEAVSTCETPVNIYQATRRDTPEDSHLHTHRRENLKLHFLRNCPLRDIVSAPKKFREKRITAFGRS